MIILLLQNAFEHLRLHWTEWWAEAFPSAVPFPEVRELPERKVLFEQLEEHRKSQTRDSAARHEAIEALTRDLSEARQRVDLLQQRLTEQHRADWLANLQASAEIERLQARILQKTPISLGMFIEEVDHELSRLRRMEPTIVPNGSDRNYSLMKKTMRFQTNAPSIRRRVAALQAARERAVAMQTENMTVQEIIGEMYQLRKTFPEIVDEETRGVCAAMILAAQ